MFVEWAAVAELAWLHLWGSPKVRELLRKSSPDFQFAVAHSFDVQSRAVLIRRGRRVLLLSFLS